MKNGYNAVDTKNFLVSDTLLGKYIYRIDDDVVVSNKDVFYVFDLKDSRAIISKNEIVFQTLNSKHLSLESIEILKNILVLLIVNTKATVEMIRTELNTFDYIKRISDVQRNYSNLMIDKWPKEKQNLVRNKEDNYKKYEQTAENLSISFEVNYYHEMMPSIYKIENFSTAEYYSLDIGRVIIAIAAYVNNTPSYFIPNTSVMETIQNLKKVEIEELKQSISQDYLKKIIL